MDFSHITARASLTTAAGRSATLDQCYSQSYQYDSGHQHVIVMPSPTRDRPRGYQHVMANTITNP